MGKPIAYSVDRAGYDDMLDLLELSAKFYQESNYRNCTTLDLDKLRDNLFIAWKSGDFITLLVRADGVRMPVGYAHVRRESVFTAENLGDLYQFFIVPAHRGRGAARMLRDAVDRQFRDWECALSYVECGAGLDDGKNDMLFFNLWRKIGYQFLGRALYRKG